MLKNTKVKGRDQRVVLKDRKALHLTSVCF